MTEEQQVIPNAEMKVALSMIKQLEARKQEEIEKGKILNQNIAKITEEQVMLRGEYRYLAKKQLEDNEKAKERGKGKKQKDASS